MLALAMAGLGQSNVYATDDRNERLTLGLTSHSYNQWVSGTKVDLALTTSSLDLEDYNGSDRWTSATVDHLQAVVDGVTFTWSPHFPFSGILPGALRIASTHFSDGATINVSLTATWTLSRTGLPQERR
jgi:hypothetical protein